MSEGRGNRDIGQALTDWMDDVAPAQSPGRLLEEAFARTVGTRQLRRYPWHGIGRRWPKAGAPWQFAATAAAAIAVLVIGVGLWNFGGPSAPNSPSPTVAPTRTPLPTLALTAVTPQASIPLAGPGEMATDGTAVWLLAATGRLVRIDPTTNTIAASVSLPSPTDGFQGIAVNETGLWITDSDLGVVLRYDPQTLRFVASIPVATTPKGVLVTDTAVWVADLRGGSVNRVDPATNTVVAKVSVGPLGRSGPNWLASGFGSIWVDVPNESSVVRIDESTGTVQAKITLAGSGLPCGGLGVGLQAVWVTSCDTGSYATRIDPTTNAGTGVVNLGGNGYTFAMVGGFPWIAPEGNRIVRINPTSNALDRAISPAPDFGGGGGVVVASGSLWVVDPGNDRILRLALTDLGD